MANNDNAYYSDFNRHGEYQSITLEEVVNNYLMSRDEDDYTSNSPRYKIIYQAKRGLRELYFDVMQSVRVMELDIPPHLTMILPPDYVDYVRISVVSNGILYPMAMDNRQNIAMAHLQDNQYNFLYDNNGFVLKGSGNRETLDSGQSVATILNNQGDIDVYCARFTPNADLSRSFKNGKFNIDKARGVIEFTSQVEGSSIVLEYISDGLYTEDGQVDETHIKVHKFAESALIDYIHWQLVKNRRNVPANEKERARKEYFNSKRQAKRRLSNIKVEDLLQVFKGDSKWIKGS